MFSRTLSRSVGNNGQKAKYDQLLDILVCVNCFQTYIVVWQRGMLVLLVRSPKLQFHFIHTKNLINCTYEAQRSCFLVALSY